MSEPTITALANAIIGIQNRLDGIEGRLTSLENGVNVYVTASDLETRAVSIENDVADAQSAISQIDEKMVRISLPPDTRYYLEESEITDFRSNFRKLRTFMSDVERSRQSMVRLLARYNLTNSSA